MEVLSRGQRRRREKEHLKFSHPDERKTKRNQVGEKESQWFMLSFMWPHWDSLCLMVHSVWLDHPIRSFHPDEWTLQCPRTPFPCFFFCLFFLKQGTVGSNDDDAEWQDGCVSQQNVIIRSHFEKWSRCATNDVICTRVNTHTHTQQRLWNSHLFMR